MMADTDWYTGSTSMTLAYFMLAAEHVGTHTSDAGAGRCDDTDSSALVSNIDQ
jgi:hypothetical protein